MSDFNIPEEDDVYDAGVELDSALSNFNPEPNETPAHLNALSPGDVIRFKYSYWQERDRYGPSRRWSVTRRLGLVVSSDRTSNGSFLSTKNNLLLNIFEVGSLSNNMMRILLKIAYKPNVCNYYRVPTILFHLLGSDQFRTFKLSDGISDVFKMTPKPEIQQTKPKPGTKHKVVNDFIKDLVNPFGTSKVRKIKRRR